MPGPPGWGLSPLQSACDFWEPLCTLTAGLAQPESRFLEMTAGGGAGAPGARQEPNFHLGGAQVRSDGCCLKLYPGPALTPSFPGPRSLQ